MPPTVRVSLPFLILVCVWLIAVSSSAQVTLVRHPYLQQVTWNSAIVVWATKEPGNAEVRYAATGESTRTATATATIYRAADTGLSYDLYHHEARLASLAARTVYTYDIYMNGADATSGTNAFTTAPLPGSGTVRFIAFGDSGTGSAAQKTLASLMKNDTFDLALHTGDIAYGNSGGTGDGSHNTLTNWFFTIYRDWLRRAPMFPSLGNHDSRAGTRDGVHYLESYVLPENGAGITYPDHAERYYSFDYGPVHFIALDTELAFQNTTRRAEQLAWLDADLASTTRPWKVVSFHRSPYSAGGEHGSDLAVRDAFGPAFEKHGGQLVLSAHEHVYERTRPIRAVTYVVTGGGGGPLYLSGTAEWTAYSAAVHHYVRATVTDCDLDLEAVNLTGAVFDRVSLNACGGGDTTPPEVTVAQPAESATVSGTTTVTTAVTDNAAVAKVDLWLDGLRTATDTSAPFEFAWNTASAVDGMHRLDAWAYDTSGNVAVSGPRTVTVANGVRLPSGWTSRDIGAVGVAGSAAESGGTFTVRGAGDDVWGTADAFHYAYRSLDGDGTIVARVAALDGTESWTKIGVMIRATTDAGSAHAFMLVSKSKGLAFQRRTATGGTSTHTSGGSGTAPRWVRLERAGSRITGSVSTDGTNWTVAGSDTFSMPASVLVGLAANSNTTSGVATGTFDNVTVSAGSSPAALPSGWTSRDIGAVGVAGSAAESGGTFTVRGAGDDVWGTADAFHYAYRPLDGDGTIVARVATLDGTESWTKLGVMIRGTTDPGSAHAFMLVSKTKGLAFQRRTATGGISTHTSGGSGTAPRWVKLQRAGNTITASVSSDGANWTLVGSDTFSMPADVLVGLAATSHTTASLATATFDNVQVVVP